MSFFLADPATQCRLSIHNTLGLPMLGSGIESEQYFVLRQQVVLPNLQPGSTDAHFCLVAVFQMVLPDGKLKPNTYLDANGDPIEGEVANSADFQWLGQHNIDIVQSHRLPSIVGVNVSSLADGSPSDLIVRTPDKIELVQVCRSLGIAAAGLRDVTRDSYAGLFEAGAKGVNIEETEVKCLPQKLAIPELERGCVRKMYVGIQLPEGIEDDKDLCGAYTLTKRA